MKIIWNSGTHKALADRGELMARETYGTQKHFVGPVGRVSFFADRSQCSGKFVSNFVSNSAETFSFLSSPLSGKVCGSNSENYVSFQRKQPASWNNFKNKRLSRLRSLSATEFERNLW